MAFGVTQRPSRGGSVDLSNYYNKPQVDANYDLIDRVIPLETPPIQVILNGSNTNGTATATASSEYPGLEAWRASDGDDSPGAIFATNAAGPHWWQMDFGQLMQCPVIEIQRRKIQSQAPTGFEVLIGETLATMRIVKAETNLAYSEDLIRYKILFKPYMRYLKIDNMRIDGNPTATIVSLQSVKVVNA